MNLAVRVAIPLCLSLLAACGGGGHAGPVQAPAPSSYRIGGSISGLTGSGLVLALNGSNTLTVPANASSFTFPTSVTAGGSYAVTIQTQPAGQSCTLSNGSGTASGNVTSIQLSCTSVTYTIGGSVSGLTAGGGIVLLDNGGDALTVAANATTFTFATPIPSGSAYAVTVQTQPNGLACTVTNGTGTAGSNITSVTLTCASTFAGGGANVVAMTVDSGPGNSSSQTFNVPFVTVTVCTAAGTGCVSIPHVMVDSGSEGLRLMASVVAGAGLTLTPAADPNNAGNTFHECAPFADGYAWGVVAPAVVKLGGESTGAAIPVELIDDSGTPNPAVPASGCANGTALNSVNAIDANGIIGVGVFAQDCGSNCTSSASNDVYWTCTSGGACTSTTVTSAEQVENPVAAFTADNNGTIIQLPALAPGGATTATGYLVFGIGTRSNNSLGSATVLTADPLKGVISTSYDNQTLTDSIIDSGSNAYFFPNSTTSPIATCTFAPAFYCPANTSPGSPLALSATMQGQNSTTASVPFQVVDLSQLNTNNFALPAVGGPANNTANMSNYFDWGLPFFYGRTVYLAIAGASAGGQTGPYYAF